MNKLVKKLMLVAAMLMLAAAERREWCSSMLLSSAATPGPKHFSSRKIRTEITGRNVFFMCSIIAYFCPRGKGCGGIS